MPAGLQGTKGYHSTLTLKHYYPVAAYDILSATGYTNYGPVFYWNPISIVAYYPTEILVRNQSCN